MHRPTSSRTRGFTLIELLVAVAVVIVLLTLAAPSFRELIALQRLKSINAELVTDMQYARSEAVSRNTTIYVKFGSSAAMSCYVLYKSAFGAPCDCTRPPGTACTGSFEEIRTTQIPVSTDVQVSVPDPTQSLTFDKDGRRPVANSYTISTTRIGGGNGQMQVTVSAMGRPTVCSPDQSISGVPACN